MIEICGEASEEDRKYIGLEYGLHNLEKRRIIQECILIQKKFDKLEKENKKLKSELRKARKKK